MPVSNDLLGRDSRYAKANEQLQEHFCRKKLRDGDEAEIANLKATLVWECEDARRWLVEQKLGSFDYWTARVIEDDLRNSDFQRALSAVETLIEIDKSQAYWFRTAFTNALVSQVENDVGFDGLFPDPNHPEGGIHVRLTSEERKVLDPQFLGQIGLSKLDRVLDELRSELQKWAARKENPWRWIGNLYVDPPLTRRERGSISRCGDTLLGIATLGLSISLSSWLRLANTNQLPMRRFSGDVLPARGSPMWSMVAEYVEAALPSEDVVTAEDLRQRWWSFSKRRTEIRLHRWPRRAIRQSQIFGGEFETD